MLVVQTPLGELHCIELIELVLNVARILVSEFKADANRTDSTGKTPLHWACFKCGKDSSIRV